VTTDPGTPNEHALMMRIPAADDGGVEIPDDVRTPVERLGDVRSPDAAARMPADSDAAGVSAQELLAGLTKTVPERALSAELDDHLGVRPRW
jgi:hypothetical protein